MPSGTAALSTIHLLYVAATVVMLWNRPCALVRPVTMLFSMACDCLSSLLRNLAAASNVMVTVDDDGIVGVDDDGTTPAAPVPIDSLNGSTGIAILTSSS